jgi:GalNAc-alpha-(1->4)-GalNAc-alpha-(1->3)-diNAcBac-PP-undecaprenol alpha-1,4-N-acetyl-D-galactosaminyltransferase
MKILLVTGSINQGGAEFQLLALANLLQRRGNNIEVLALTDHTHYLGYIKDNGIVYSCIPNEGSNAKRVIRSVLAIKKSKPDLVISYIRATSMVAMLAKCMSLFRFKLIISERTGLITPKYDLLYFNLALSANAITVNSKPKADYIKRKFPALKSRTVFMPNIINVEHFINTRKTIPADNVVRISYVGRISPEKNLFNLIRAVGELKKENFKISLSLHGAPSNKLYLEEILRLIEELGLRETVRYQGATRDVATVYANSDLLCLVSIFEGFSNVLSEAICSGVPVIASDIEENRFLVEEGVNGFLANPADHLSIAAALRKACLLTSPEWLQISNNNKEKARLIFDEEKIYESYKDLFRSIGYHGAA